MENNEEEIVLSLLYGLKQSVSSTKLQKLLFLVKQETKISLNLDFMPYKYGPFSQAIYGIIENLESKGIIKVKYSANKSNGQVRLISLSDFGMVEGSKAYESLGENERSSLDEIVSRWGNEPLMSILLYTYLTYPDVIVNSVIKEKILS